jgi:DNA repair exonuclease SbcCD nuclease subunit
MDVINQIRQIHVDRNIPYSVFLGDLFHTRDTLDVSVIWAVTQALRKLSEVCTIILMTGNHDMHSRSGSIHALEPFKDFCMVVDRPQELLIEEHWFSICPYQEDPDDLKRAMAQFKNRDYLLLHAGLEEATAGPLDLKLRGQIPAGLMKEWKLALVGHYHRAQNQDNWWVPGSPLMIDFAERNDPPKGVLLVDEYRVQRLELEAPQFLKFELDDLLDFGQFEELRSMLNGHYAEVTVPKNLVSEISKQLPGVLVSPKYEQAEGRARMDLANLEDDSDLLMRYLVNKNPDSSQDERLLGVGIRLLKEVS